MSQVPDDLSLQSESDQKVIADSRQCPLCYETYEYGPDAAKNLVPRLLKCGHLMCTGCVPDCLIEDELNCPNCFESIQCTGAEDLPVPECSPLPSPSSPTHAFELISGMESDGSVSSTSSVPNRMKEFMLSSPSSKSEKVGALTSHFSIRNLPHSQNKFCVMDGCNRRRFTGKYFCEHHQEKARRVTWKTTERLLKRYEDVSHYRQNAAQDGKLYESRSEPNLEHLSPENLCHIFDSQDTLTMGEALWILDEAISLIKNEPNLLQLSAPINLVGDIHGQYFDLRSMLKKCGIHGDIADNSDRQLLKKNYLFLGDYVDRGEYSCEVMFYLLSLKLTNPTRVHLLRGNHECRSLTTHFGFKSECTNKYGLPVYYRFLKLFMELPISAIVQSEKGRYFCAHGGISPEFSSLNDIDLLDRRIEPPMNGMLCDILWADPADDTGLTQTPNNMNEVELENLVGQQFAPNRLRGCSVSFGYAAAVEFLNKNDLLCVIRAHAVQEGGYYRHFEEVLRHCRKEIFAKIDAGEAPDLNDVPNHIWDIIKVERSLPAVMTVFSAPNYCGRFGNKGAILTIERDILEPIVVQYDCVPSPSPRPDMKSRANVHITSLIEACPYMPSTFRDFVVVAGRIGPAQPLQGAKSNAQVYVAANVCGATQGVAVTTKAIEERVRRTNQRRAGSFAAVVGDYGDEGRMSNHVLYKAMAANDRINERHPDALFLGREPKINRNGSLQEIVKKVSIQALLRRFEPKYRKEINPAVSPTSSTASSSPIRKHRSKEVYPKNEENSQRESSSPRGGRKRLNLEVENVRKSTERAKPSSPSNSKSSRRQLRPMLERVPLMKSLEASQSSFNKEKLMRQNIFGYGILPSSPRSNLSWKAKTKVIHPLNAENEEESGGSGKNKGKEEASPVSNPSERKSGTAASESVGSDKQRNSGDVGKKLTTPPRRRATSGMMGETSHGILNRDADEYSFSEAEMLGLKLLFAIMDYNDTKYIDATALQMYAGEHNDYAQVSEVEACINAVDVDNDGKIGLMDFLSFAARLKLFYDMGIAQEKEKGKESEALDSVAE